MSTREQLNKLINDLKTKKYREGEAKGLMNEIQKAQTEALAPVLENMAKQIGEVAKSAIEQAIKDIKVEIPPIEVPPVDVRYPDIPAPIVNVAPPQVHVKPSDVHIPEVKFPETKFPEMMKVVVDGVDNKRPLPVMMFGMDGKPMSFSMGVGGGGKADFFTIKGFGQSAFSELTNPDGRVKVELPSGSSGLTDTELRASSVPVAQASDALWSVSVKEIFGSTITALLNGDNRIPVSVETGGSGLTDSELRASSVPVAQASGANWSVSVTDIFGSTGANVINPDGRVKVELPTGSSGLTDTELRASSVPVEQVSGSIWSVYATGFGASIGAFLLNADGTYRDTLPVDISAQSVGDISVTGSVAVSGFSATVGANIVDSSGVAYSGSNPVPVSDGSTAAAALSDTLSNPTTKLYGSATLGFDGTNWERVRTGTGYSDGALRVVHATDVGLSVTATVSGSVTSTVVVGDIVADAVDTQSAPVKVGGIARTANPTAVAAGDRVSSTHDDLGRQVMRPLQVRDLVRTAYVSVTNGTETTLLAATAGSYLDCVAVMCSNNSDAAVSVDIRPVTAGNIVYTIRIPANGTAGWAPPVPWPQSDTGNNWTIDGPDETGRTITASGLFILEI